MELNTIQIFLAKRWLFSIWILASRGHNEGNKFCILDGTKHHPKNFGILHFIIPKTAVFSSSWKKFRDTIALSFVCGNYCPTID